MMRIQRRWEGGLLTLAAAALAACGGGGGGGTPAPGGGGSGATTYSVSVTVTGLSGSTLVVEDNGKSSGALSFTTSKTQTFSTQLASGAAYAVTVSTQPAGQDCLTNNGSGTVTNANVSVAINCAPLINYWTWIGGSDGLDQAGSYGPKGQAAAGNFPGARRLASTWTDANGNLWIFGGEGRDSAGTLNYLNDLWEYSNGQWTWVSGSNTVLGLPISNNPSQNTPGARLGAVSWTDTAGTLWLFGGFGNDSTGNVHILNDLWQFSGGQWAFVGGNALGGAPGLYGTQGQAGQSTSTSFPGARYSASTWRDAQGNQWLFGGYGVDATSTTGLLNDLWEFDGTHWTYVSGSNAANAGAVWGTQGMPGAGNTPGARYLASAWTDATGNLWLFGGDANAAGTEATNFCLNDLWKFSGGLNAGVISGTWTWVGGSQGLNTSGSYGTKDAAAAGNAPGARFSANAWVDATGKLWLFGGIGYDSVGANFYLNDVWKFDVTTGLWTWASGATTADSPGTYGTLNVPSLRNSPGARAGASSWIDSSGTVWLFGGFGFDAAGSSSYLNDYWHFAQQ